MKPNLQPNSRLDLAQLVTQARQLTLKDQIRLVSELAREIDRQLAQTPPGPDLALRPKPTSRRSAWGLCADLGRSPSAEEIDAARAELWSGFPRP